MSTLLISRDDEKEVKAMDPTLVIVELQRCSVYTEFTRYVIVNRISTTLASVVYSAVVRPDHRTRVAIKELDQVFRTQLHATRVWREIVALRLFGTHPFIVSLLQVERPLKPMATFDQLQLVFPHASTTLFTLFHDRSVILSTAQVRKYLYQMLCAVNYIHSAKWMHRDLKLANFLVNDKGDLEMADFGHARPFDLLPGLPEDVTTGFAHRRVEQINPTPTHLRQRSAHVATRTYRAPEIILRSKTYGPEMDMWSVGCLFGDLLQMQQAGKRTVLFPSQSCYPFTTDHSDDAYAPTDQLHSIFRVIGTPTTSTDLASITNEQAREFVDDLEVYPATDLHKRFPLAEESGLDLLKALITFDPERRITALQALHHPFLASVSDEAKGMSFTLPADTKSLSLLYRYEFELEAQAAWVSTPLIPNNFPMFNTALIREGLSLEWKKDGEGR